MKPNILICGRTGAGKTSLIQALTSGIVPDNAIGHCESTTKGFVVYETDIANFIDCEGLIPGKITIGQYADFIRDEMYKRIESEDPEQVITSVLYCIDGSSARWQSGDLELIKSLDKRTKVVITKADVMRRDQGKELNKELLKSVSSSDVFIVSSAESTGLQHLLDGIRLMAECSEDQATREIEAFRKKWDDYYREKSRIWEEKLSKEADSFIHWATGRAAAIALVPIPLADVAPLVANEIYMIYKLGNIYGFAVGDQIITMLTGIAGGSFAGKLLASFLPGLKIPIAAGITYGVGMATKAYFASGMKLNEKELKEKFKQAEKESKKTDWKSESERTKSSPNINDKTFKMEIEDVFDFAGRGLVCTGRIECGKIRVGEFVDLEYKNGSTIKKHIKVSGIEKFREQLQEAETGTNVGIMLTGILANEVRPYMILTKEE